MPLFLLLRHLCVDSIFVFRAVIDIYHYKQAGLSRATLDGMLCSFQYNPNLNRLYQKVKLEFERVAP